MWIAITAAALVTFFVFVMLFVAIIQKNKRIKAKANEANAIAGIEAGIRERLHAAYPGSRWRWVCCPKWFHEYGGIARIEVLDASNNSRFMDICLSAKGYMALHVSCAYEQPVSDADLKTQDMSYETAPRTSTKASAKPIDEESIGKWYKIVLFDTLNGLIDDLNAKNEVSLFIEREGKAYADENGSSVMIYDFGDMPDVSLWGIITEMLGESGLYAEVQDENCLFISWA